MHRWVWNPAGGGRGGFGGGAPAGAAGAPGAAGAAGRAGRGGRGGGRGRGAAPIVSGTFTARLTVNGQTYTQTFNVKPDPRAK
jgi:hypothetical protein